MNQFLQQFKDYRFEHPWWLLLLLALPLWAYLRSKQGSVPSIQFPVSSIFRGMGIEPLSRKGGQGWTLLYFALGIAIIALARPQRVNTYEETKSEGVSIVISCDVSLSMLIRDFYIGSTQVDRLTAAKRVITDFIKGRSNDRIGIVAFAGEPYNPCPPTLDHDWILKNMDRIQTGIMEDGTAIGSGIAAAARRLDKLESKSKIIVLLTDGANNSGKLSPQVAAKMAATLGIKIYTISIGTPGMHLIYTPGGGVINSGRQEFDTETLDEIARIGNGKFYRAENLKTLSEVFQTINELEKSEIESKKIIETHELYQPLLIVAAFLAGLYLWWKQSLGRLAPSSL